MALIFLGALIVFIGLSFDFHQVTLPWLANIEWPPFNQTSVYWIIRFEGSAGVLSQAATETNFQEFKK